MVVSQIYAIPVLDMPMLLFGQWHLHICTACRLYMGLQAQELRVSKMPAIGAVVPDKAVACVYACAPQYASIPMVSDLW